MINDVSFERVSFKHPPHKFEAGTPNMAGAIGLAAAMDYLDAVGRDAIFAHDQELAEYTYARLGELPGIRLFGPRTNRGGLVAFALGDVHAHDLVTLADQKGIALRGGHHCTQPLMKKLGVTSTARASFYFYNTKAEVDRLIEVLAGIQKFFG
jgi:cysteine desulfurase / selenocysteine lyase